MDIWANYKEQKGRKYGKKTWNSNLRMEIQGDSLTNTSLTMDLATGVISTNPGNNMSEDKGLYPGGASDEDNAYITGGTFTGSTVSAITNQFSYATSAFSLAAQYNLPTARNTVFGLSNTQF